MTTVAVFSSYGGSTIHLLADTLGSLAINSRTSELKPTQLSTGLILDETDQAQYTFSEGSLKIGIVQSNIAIGYAGNSAAANAALRLLKEYGPFSRFFDFQQFLTDRVIPSVTPCEGGIELCGFMIGDQGGIKFRYSAETDFECTQDPSVTFVCGSGGPLVKSMLARIFRDEEPLDPGIEFIQIAQPFYIDEFLGNKTNIKNFFTGGAISGLYAEKGRVSWQKSHAVIVFVNVGGHGANARFKRLPIVHKTWYEKGNLFSSSFMENDGHYIQRVIQYSNTTSGSIYFEKSHLLPNMRTFDTDVLTVILLPRGFASDLHAAISFSRRDGSQGASFFEEVVEKGRLSQYRVSPLLLQQVNDSVVVRDDYTIDLKLNGTEAWDVIGVASFMPCARIIYFEWGVEKIKFLCVEGLLYKRSEPPESPSLQVYLGMKGVLLPESGQLPSKLQIRAIHIPVMYITHIELGPYFRFHDPGEVPTLLVMPDFSPSTHAMPLGEIKEALKELPVGRIITESQTGWDRLR